MASFPIPSSLTSLTLGGKTHGAEPGFSGFYFHGGWLKNCSFQSRLAYLLTHPNRVVRSYMYCKSVRFLTTRSYIFGLKLFSGKIKLGTLRSINVDSNGASLKNWLQRFSDTYSKIYRLAVPNFKNTEHFVTPRHG